MKNIKFMLMMRTCLVALGIAHLGIGWAESVEDKVKEWVDDGAKAIKKGVDKLGEDFDAIQEYLDNYHWKGLIEKKATSGPATLKHLELNGHSRAVVVKPGDQIQAEVTCKLDAKKCSAFGLYRAVVGIKGEGPQTVIAGELGLVAGKTKEKFTLVAPQKSGMYQIRFRCVNALSEAAAMAAWEDDKGQEPDGTTTIGVIFVK